MGNKKTIQKIIIGLVIAVLLLVAYAIVSDGDGTDATASGALTSLRNAGSLGQLQETDTALANAEILRILGNIQDIDLDDGIFSNNVFRELVDSGFNIQKPLRIGRPNPFLPIGFDSIAGSGQVQVQENIDIFNSVVDDRQVENTEIEQSGSTFFDDPMMDNVFIEEPLS